MKTVMENISTLERKLHIEVPQDKVAQVFQSVVESKARKVELKGFRKGKAPRNLVLSMYGAEIRENALQKIIQASFVEALQKEGVHPIGMPEFSFDEFSDDGVFSFVAEFSVPPELDGVNYQDLNVTRPNVEVTDEEVAESIEKLRAQRATVEACSEGTPATETSVVKVRYTKSGEDSEKEGHLELSDTDLMPELRDALTGAQAGETKTVVLNRPAPEEGAPAIEETWDVNVVNVLEKKLPAVDEDFAKAYGEYASVDALKEGLKDRMSQMRVVQAEQTFRKDVLNKVVVNNVFPVPKALLKEQTEKMHQRIRADIERDGHSEDTVNAYFEKWGGEIDEMAQSTLRSFYIVHYLADQWSLKCDKEDLDQAITRIAAQQKRDVTSVRAELERQQRMEELAFEVVENKVIDKLIEEISPKA